MLGQIVAFVGGDVLFRAFSDVWKLEDVMIKPVTTIESVAKWRESYEKMEHEPLALLQADTTDVWQVIFPLQASQERPLLGYSFPLFGKSVLMT